MQEDQPENEHRLNNSEERQEQSESASTDRLQEQDPIEYIKHMLESKSTAKQTTFKHLKDAFSVLCSES